MFSSCFRPKLNTSSEVYEDEEAARVKEQRSVGTISSGKSKPLVQTLELPADPLSDKHADSLKTKRKRSRWLRGGASRSVPKERIGVSPGNASEAFAEQLLRISEPQQEFSMLEVEWAGSRPVDGVCGRLSIASSR